jgi:hypothetical protein
MNISHPVATRGSGQADKADPLTRLVPLVQDQEGEPGLEPEPSDRPDSVVCKTKTPPYPQPSGCSRGFSVKAMRHAMQAMFS